MQVRGSESFLDSDSPYQLVGGCRCAPGRVGLGDEHTFARCGIRPARGAQDMRYDPAMTEDEYRVFYEQERSLRARARAQFQGHMDRHPELFPLSARKAGSV